MKWRRLWFAISIGVLVALSGCGGGSSGGGTTGGASSGGSIQRGGDVIIARTQESLGMDNTAVFDNESIWIFQQMFESLYTVSEDGKSVKPWLATGYDLSPDQLTYTFHLRKGVKFHTGQEMTSADVKFSIDAARQPDNGWAFIDSAIKKVDAPDPYTVVVTTKYKWAPLVADIALFNNAVLPKDYGGMTKKQFYDAPVGTGPFKWDHWTHGQEIKLVKNANYWQKGKPYLDSVTWTTVPTDATRELQLKGGQVQVDEFPPFSSIDTLKQTPGVTITLFPSTRTDYMPFNFKVKPFDDPHVRRAISLAVDRQALVDSVLFGYGDPANSFMPPQVPYYDKSSPGLQYDMTAAKAEMAQSSVPNGFSFEQTVGSGVDIEAQVAQVLQQSLKQLNIDMKIRKVDPSVEFAQQQKFDYQMTFAYWTMDIADPDELVSFAVDNKTAGSFFTDYNDPQQIAWTKQAQSTFDPAQRQALYSQIQKKAAEDAFMVFLWYSPYRYAYSDKLQGFQVYPTGNYHMEDVWLKQ
ncbi:MAG: peptide/nickel transport system substrate-binding protein [Gaiellales bacterium]|nr:peptide/nickel transport system substrate-binding protein [Gaiellales bacterium]